MRHKQIVAKSYKFFLSKESSHKAEVFTIWLSIISFIVHLLLILLTHTGLFPAGENYELLQNPISAIYTPFSFILLYEVYQLVYHIPQSTSTYVGKQYEIITLIVVRRLFKDIANLDINQDWFTDAYDLQFTYDIVTTLILFFLIYFFHLLNRKEELKPFESLPGKVRTFVRRKRALATILVPIIIGMAIYSFSEWFIATMNYSSETESSASILNMNNIFFDEFFELLILTDVLLLLLSFFNTNRFNLVIRNSGFIISTILLRLSFSIDGILNNLLIVTAVLFGVLILWINNKYEKLRLNQ